MIPRILFRTVPARTTRLQEEWWATCCALTPGWEHRTYRDGDPEMDPRHWPLTAPYWGRCTSGAQRADLLRVEAMMRTGGVYVDSDVELVRPLDALLGSRMFAAWEDERAIPNAVFGAEADHPALRLILDCILPSPDGSRPLADVPYSGPGVFTDVLRDRHEDVVLLPPGSFYPYHYKEKAAFDQTTPEGRAALAALTARSPWVYAVHHWNHSWRGSG